MPGGEGAQPVQSVRRAASLLACFASAAGPLVLTDLARRTDLNASTTYRILQTLCTEGLLQREPDGERYLIGPVLAALGRAAITGSGMLDSLSVLRDLVVDTHESASLGARHGDEVVVRLRVESHEPLRFDRPPGVHVPLHASAMGKALLAFGPDPVSDALAGLSLIALTPKTITSFRQLGGDLNAAKE